MPATVSPYQISVVSRPDEVERIRPFWESAQWHPGADLELYKIVLQTRPEIISPCIFVVSKDDKTVALWIGRLERSKLALRIGYASAGSIPTKKLVMIEGGLMGADDPEVWTSLLQFAASYLIQEKIDLASIDQVAVASTKYTSAMERFGRAQLRPARQSGKHWLLRLPTTWPEFMAARSKKRRYWLNRLPKILDRDFPAKWEMRVYKTEAEAQAFVDAAEAVASKTYHRGLGVGFRKNEETNRRVAKEAQHGHLVSYILFINDEPTAFWYCTRYRQRLYLEATGYDPKYGRYEVGTVLLLKIFQDYCGSDIELVDFGLGDAEYKQRFGTENFEEITLLLFSRSARGRFLSAVHTSVAGCNQLARQILDRLQVTQRIKTIWRRGKIQKTEKIEVEADAAAES